MFSHPSFNSKMIKHVLSFLSIYVNVNTLEAYRGHFKHSKYLKREIIYSIFKAMSPLFQCLKNIIKGRNCN